MDHFDFRTDPPPVRRRLPARRWPVLLACFVAVLLTIGALAFAVLFAITREQQAFQLTQHRGSDAVLFQMRVRQHIAMSQLMAVREQDRFWRDSRISVPSNFSSFENTQLEDFDRAIKAEFGLDAKKLRDISPRHGMASLKLQEQAVLRSREICMDNTTRIFDAKDSAGAHLKRRLASFPSEDEDRIDHEWVRKISGQCRDEVNRLAKSLGLQ